MNSRYVEDAEIRAQRVNTWVRAVRLKSKLSLAELEEHFSDSNGSTDKARSCIWDKYNRGDVVPRIGVKPNGELHLASRVEKEFSGTLQWLTSPMWRLIDKAPMSMQEIRVIYEAMPTEIGSIFVEPKNNIKGIFWKRLVDPEDCLKALKHFERFPVFIALLAMVKEAETTQDQWTHYFALKEAIDLTEYLTLIPEIDLKSISIEEYLIARGRSAGYAQN